MASLREPPQVSAISSSRSSVRRRMSQVRPRRIAGSSPLWIASRTPCRVWYPSRSATSSVVRKGAVGTGGDSPGQFGVLSRASLAADGPGPRAAAPWDELCGFDSAITLEMGQAPTRAVDLCPAETSPTPLWAAGEDAGADA